MIFYKNRDEILDGFTRGREIIWMELTDFERFWRNREGKPVKLPKRTGKLFGTTIDILLNAVVSLESK